MTKKEYLLYILIQIVSIACSVKLGFYLYSLTTNGHIDKSILKPIFTIIIFGMIGLIIPCIIFFRKTGGWGFLVKSIGLGLLGLICGLIIYVLVIAIAFTSKASYLSSGYVPITLGICGLISGSVVALKWKTSNKQVTKD